MNKRKELKALERTLDRELISRRGDKVYVDYNALSKETQKIITNTYLLYLDFKKPSNDYMSAIGKNLIELGVLPKNFTSYEYEEKMSFYAHSINKDNPLVAVIDLTDDEEKDEEEEHLFVGIQHLNPFVKITWEKGEEKQ